MAVEDVNTKIPEAYRELADNAGKAGEAVIDGQKRQWQRDEQGNITVELGNKQGEHHFLQISGGSANGVQVRDVRDRVEDGRAVRNEVDTRYDQGGNLLQKTTRKDNEREVTFESYDGQGHLTGTDKKTNDGDRVVDVQTNYDNRGQVSLVKTTTRDRQDDGRESERVTTRTPNSDGTYRQVGDQTLTGKDGTTLVHMDMKVDGNNDYISGTRTTTAADGKTTSETYQGGAWQPDQKGIGTRKGLVVADLDKPAPAGTVQDKYAEQLEQIRNNGMRFKVAEASESALASPGQAYAAELLDQVRNRKAELS